MKHALPFRVIKKLIYSCKAHSGKFLTFFVPVIRYLEKVKIDIFMVSNLGFYDNAFI